MEKTNWRIMCTCPAMKFWGFNYILTKRNSILGPGENRFPDVRNPKLIGICCKHLWITLNYLHINMDKIVDEIIPFIKNYYGIQTESKRQQTLKKIGLNGLKKLLNDIKTSIVKIDKSLNYEFDEIIKSKKSILEK